MHPIDRSGEERAQEEREKHPILDYDIGGQRKEIEADVLVVEWVARAIGHLIEEPQEDAPIVDLSPGDKHGEEAGAAAITTGHGSRWRMNSNTSGNVATPVGFHSKSAGRCIHGDWAKRNASDPFTHRMMAVATKTAKNTSASAMMVVQKTPK